MVRPEGDDQTPVNLAGGWTGTSSMASTAITSGWLTRWASPKCISIRFELATNWLYTSHLMATITDKSQIVIDMYQGRCPMMEAGVMVFGLELWREMLKHSKNLRRACRR